MFTEKQFRAKAGSRSCILFIHSVTINKPIYWSVSQLRGHYQIQTSIYHLTRDPNDNTFPTLPSYYFGSRSLTGTKYSPCPTNLLAIFQSCPTCVRCSLINDRFVFQTLTTWVQHAVIKSHYDTKCILNCYLRSKPYRQITLVSAIVRLQSKAVKSEDNTLRYSEQFKNWSHLIV